jgi:ABC-2 type transport system ATP-binding protein
MDEVIRCEGLAKRYREVTALAGLDLSVPGGQVYGFLGPNGAGKTTTLRILLGLVRPTAGRAWLNGRPVPDPDGLARVGAMIEEPAFYPWLSGRRNLEVFALAGPPLPAGPGPVEAALARTGLAPVAGRKVKGYSQGMRQRLALAAALMREPSLLLLDEPTNGMDPAGIAEFRVLLRSLAGEGVTVFLSSHLLAEVEQICDQVAVISSGRLAAQGPVAALTAAGTGVRVAVDPADQAAALALLARWHARPQGSGAVFVEGADGATVNQALGRGGIWAREITTARSGLEETFLRMTQATGTQVDHAAAAR